MIINVYDLTGREQFACIKADGENDILPFVPKDLHTLLIYPKRESSNRSPYLQDNQSPCLDDFIDDNNKFDFSGSIFLSEMLRGEVSKEKKDHLMNFFSYENGVLRINEYSREAENDEIVYYIILIPDHYDANKQEQILRCCGLPRERTFLLWRSVAICIGAEKTLSAYGIREGMKVAIFDPQAEGHINASILTMRQDESMLVPCRSSFNKTNNYPVVDCKMHPDTLLENQLVDVFWEHTWHRDGSFWAPTEEGIWKEKSFRGPHYSYSLPTYMETADFILINKTKSSEIIHGNCLNHIIEENPKDYFALKGAGLFAIRNHYGLPTYFDECESLYFIVQDSGTETIIPKELIQGGEYCKGGRKIEGEPNKDFYLEKEKKQISFLLHVGDINQTTPLKELIHPFKEETSQDQRLTLKPSMIPGQGIAKVQVEAFPLLQYPVELDFLTMRNAMYVDDYGFKKPKTISYLQKILPRSFPIDFPDVEASYSRFDSYSVRQYLENNVMLDGDCFYNPIFPNIYSTNLDNYSDRFKRINAFGTQSGKEFPFENKEFFHRLFLKIAEDYSKNNVFREDLVRLAAWTYRCGQDEFKQIIDDTLSSIAYLASGLRFGLKRQYFTVCSNMLSEKQQQLFIRYFIQYSSRRINDASSKNVIVSKVDEWVRALMGILIYSNNCLKDITSEECKACMNNLGNIWASYTYFNKDKPYVVKVVCCLLFLLRRRKYDRSYLKKENDSTFLSLKELCSSHLNKRHPSSLDQMASSFLDYLEGKGSLDIPIGDVIQ